jgi:hypothetical protein
MTYHLKRNTVESWLMPDCQSAARVRTVRKDGASCSSTWDGRIHPWAGTDPGWSRRSSSTLPLEIQWSPLNSVYKFEEQECMLDEEEGEESLSKFIPRCVITHEATTHPFIWDFESLQQRHVANNQGPGPAGQRGRTTPLPNSTRAGTSRTGTASRTRGLWRQPGRVTRGQASVHEDVVPVHARHARTCALKPCLAFGQKLYTPPVRLEH